MQELILVVDDEPKVSRLARDYLEKNGFRVMVCADGPSALLMARRERPALIILDLMLPGRNGLSALAAIRDAAPGVPVVVVSGESDPGMVRAAIDGGAMGFIPKSSTPEVMIQALQLVLAHGIYLPPMVLEAAYTSSAPAPRAASTLPGLTPRQMDVLRGVIKGKANKAIAKELELSEGTVKAHLSAVFQALGVHSRTEAVYAAANQGLRLP